MKFDASPTTGDTPLKVHFYDLTTLSNGEKEVNRLWDFGDGISSFWNGEGTSSLTRNPTHTYTTPRKYKVTLIEGATFKKGNFNDDIASKVIEVY